MTYDTQALIWQSFFALTTFISTFACYLLPILIFTKRNRCLNETIDSDGIEDIHNDANYWNALPNVNITAKKRFELKRLLSYCNCVSAGVFLGVCFLNLIPYVEKEFGQLINDFDDLKHLIGDFPLGLFSVVAGLFFVLILESLLSNCLNGHGHSPSNSSVLYLDYDLNESRSDSNEHEELLINTELHDVKLESSDCSANAKTNGMNGHYDNHGHYEIDSHEGHFLHPNAQQQHQQHQHHPHHHHHQRHQQQQQHHHGHHHYDPQMFFSNQSNSMLTFFILMFATSIHSLFEGLALGLQTNIKNAIHLFIGIVLHECLVALALGLNAVRLQQQSIQLRMHLKFAFIFSLTIPTGNILGILLGYTPGHFGRFISAIFQGFAAGTFIHVTFLELIPSELLTNDCDSDRSFEQQSISTALHNPATTAGEAAATTLLTTSSTNGSLHSTEHLSKPNRADNVKLKKILLLLLGFLIMSIFPFICSE